MKRRKTYATGQMGWNRDSHLVANISAAIGCAAVLAMLVLAVYVR